mmetsp:Transcript_25757/g.56001  ORF Transcript_25757/g.56001 Transcript_25757/m.56001 type:complete len:694 (-) Transcript_25757:313-2394(-)|eukprot:CAMPEP_0206436968 /NCGR_PEP_ID=MMETSP0324_2-20121206/10778_1 /ASSEMBLY_ACC=CAM_ASM_000836 /TAXON_ID=2866 /ORGANISM="Crypthecodinium cohnii, Strain Seligo" /LENGTH=693 /DNA_ID=CAMNT_0053904193 /DNA_START=80 /DNA_END=2161 /DNA_ORIENTATION=+
MAPEHPETIPAQVEEEEHICRYCFEGPEVGELLAPCKCSGGQKYVHLSCLRRWQRGLLVSQPTHPSLMDDRDMRHRICNVCKATFNCKPPTVMELMSSFTGADVANLIQPGSIIGSSHDFSTEIRQQTSGLPAVLLEEMSDMHWVNGVYFIIKIVEDKGARVCLSIRDDEGLQSFAGELAEDFTVQIRGRTYTLDFRGPLEHAMELGREEKLQAIRSLTTPCQAHLSADGGDRGEDGVVAVNLTRPFDLCSSPVHLKKRLRLQAALQKASINNGEFMPELVHFLGGPCTKDIPVVVIVIAFNGRYEVFHGLVPALKAAQEMARKEQLKEWCQSRTEQAFSPSSSSTSPAVQKSGKGGLSRGNSDPEGKGGPLPKRRRIFEAGANDLAVVGSPYSMASLEAVPSSSEGLEAASEAADSTLGAASSSAASTAFSASQEQLLDQQQQEQQQLEQPDQPNLLPELIFEDGLLIGGGHSTLYAGKDPRRPQKIRVHIYWGTAGWGRSQLIAETATGSWGLCPSIPSDLLNTEPQALFEAVYPRLSFAPKTEMSENYGHRTAQDAGVSEEDIALSRRSALRLLRRRHLRRASEAAEIAARVDLEALAPETGSPQTSPRPSVVPSPATPAAGESPEGQLQGDDADDDEDEEEDSDDDDDVDDDDDLDDMDDLNELTDDLEESEEEVEDTMEVNLAFPRRS